MLCFCFNPLLRIHQELLHVLEEGKLVRVQTLLVDVARREEAAKDGAQIATYESKEGESVNRANVKVYACVLVFALCSCVCM